MQGKILFQRKQIALTSDLFDVEAHDNENVNHATLSEYRILHLGFHFEIINLLQEFTLRLICNISRNIQSIFELKILNINLSLAF